MVTESDVKSFSQLFETGPHIFMGSKVHVAVDEEAKSMAITLSPGNTHD